MNRTIYFLALSILVLGCSETSQKENTQDINTYYEVLTDLNNLIDISEIEEDPDAYVIVDVREKVDFESGHMDGAINISRGSFISTDWSEVMKDSEKTYAVYDKDFQSAHGAWLLLKTFVNGDLYILSDENSEGIAYDGANYEYAAIMDKIRKEYEDAIEKEKLLAVKPAPKVVPVKKKKKVEEEEEGCS